MTLEIGSRSMLRPLLLSACLAEYLIGAHSVKRMVICGAGGEQPAAASNLGLAFLL